MVSITLCLAASAAPEMLLCLSPGTTGSDYDLRRAMAPQMPSMAVPSSFVVVRTDSRTLASARTNR